MHVGHIIIVGAMKAGTTMLYHLLSQHRQVVTACKNGYRSPKELDFFLEKRTRSYERLFPGRLLSRTWTLEASPSYTKGYFANGCEERIAAVRKKTKLIYILRDPIDRIESHAAHNARMGRKIRGRYASQVFKDASRYWQHIQRFSAAGLSDSLLLLDFNELSRDPVNTLRRVHAFIGLRFEAPLDVTVQNPRTKAGRVLTEAQEREYWDDIRADVEALAASGRFDGAKVWLDTWSRKFG